MPKVTHLVLVLFASVTLPLAAAGDEPSTSSAKLTSQAEAQYAAGKIASAYKTLQQALQADPNNMRALSAMSIVALRAGNADESLEASFRVATTSARPKMMADAWFNYGLACQVTGRVEINGRMYCERGVVQPLLSSWELRQGREGEEHEQIRAVDKRVDEYLRSPAAKACVVKGPNQAEHRYHFVVETKEVGPTQRIYVQHPRVDSVKRVPVTWGSSESGGSMARQIARYDLEAFSVTVMEAKEYVKYPIRIGTQTCEEPRSLDRR
jgi:tetratricopeptide (TPR) repeat protein